MSEGGTSNEGTLSILVYVDFQFSVDKAIVFSCVVVHWDGRNRYQYRGVYHEHWTNQLTWLCGDISDSDWIFCFISYVDRKIPISHSQALHPHHSCLTYIFLYMESKMCTCVFSLITAFIPLSGLPVSSFYIFLCLRIFMWETTRLD